MNTEVSPLLYSIAANSATRIYNVAISVASLIIIARLLGPEGQGTAAAAIALATLFGTVAGLSLGQITQHRLQARGKNGWDGALFSSLILMLAILSLLAYVIVGITYLFAGSTPFGDLPLPVLAIALALIPFIVGEEYTSNLMAAAGKINVLNRIQVIGRSVSLVVLILLVGVFEAGIRGALISHLAGQVIIFITSLITLRRYISVTWRADLHEVGALLSGAMRLHPNTIGTFFLAQSTVLILNIWAPKATVGWYYLSWQLVTMLLLIPQAASLVTYGLIAKSNPDRAWPAHKHIVISVMSVMTLLAIAAYFLGPWIIVYLAGNEFAPATKLFQILLPALLGLSFAQLLAPQWISRGIFLPTSLITFATAVLYVAASVILVQQQGVIGAAWATSLCLTLVPLVVQGYFMWWCEQRHRSIGTVTEQQVNKG